MDNEDINAGEAINLNHKNEMVIPVLEEFAEVETSLIERERVIISKKIIEEEISVNIPVTTEHYDIERIPVSRYVDSKPEIRQEDDTIIIPVVKEVFVKRLLVTEEIRLKKKVTQYEAVEKIVLKKEEVTIERKEM